MGGDDNRAVANRPRSPSVSHWPREDTTVATSDTSPGKTPTRSPRKSKPSRSSSSFPLETDPAILARRQKQIDYGKNTLVYQQYVTAVPRAQRLGYHPRTPVKRRQQSRRRWDHSVKCWRVQLHYWRDPEKLAALRGAHETSGSDASSVAEEGERPGEGDGDECEEDEGACGDSGNVMGGDVGTKCSGGRRGSAGDGEEEPMSPDWADDVEGMAAELV